MKQKYGLGEIISKRRQAELSFLHAIFCTDLLYKVLLKYSKWLTEIQARHEVKYGTWEIIRK